MDTEGLLSKLVIPKFLKGLKPFSWGLVLIGLAALVLVLSKSDNDQNGEGINAAAYETRFDDCIDKYTERLIDLTAAEELNYSFQLCRRISYYALQLQDYRIRKSKFLVQLSADPVILWMVVLITLSGVVLAAYQLHEAFKLAQRIGSQKQELGGELSFGADTGFVVKSSVTGLLILAVSLAFFLVYARFVYKIEFISSGQSTAVVEGNKASHQDSSQTYQASGIQVSAGGIVHPTMPETANKKNTPDTSEKKNLEKND